MFRTEKMQSWLRIEAARRTGALKEAEERTEASLKPRNLRIEAKDANGRWVDWDDREPDEVAGGAS